MRKRNKIVSGMSIILLLLFMCRNVFASDMEEHERGKIFITMPECERMDFEYAKVATEEHGEYKLLEKYQVDNLVFKEDMSANDVEKMANALNQHVIPDGVVKLDNEGRGYIENLEEGVYLIRMSGLSESVSVSPMLVAVPMQNEITGKQEYQVEVLPKYKTNTPRTVKTGDINFLGGYQALFLISLIIVVGLTCHNRFKCGRISGNYSEKGGYTHGNDNDTKNSRCTRWIRSRGSRSIN